jgi:hypothetical protein
LTLKKFKIDGNDKLFMEVCQTDSELSVCPLNKKNNSNIVTVFQLIKSKKDVTNFSETNGIRVVSKCQFLYFLGNEKMWFLAKAFTKKSKLFLKALK